MQKNRGNGPLAIGVVVAMALAGRATALWIGNELLEANRGGHSNWPLAAIASAESSVRANGGQSIVARNVFCSQCRPAPVRPVIDRGPAVSPTTLPLELVSTMYVSEKPALSIAVLRDLSLHPEQVVAVARGRIVGGAEVLRVEPRRVLLLHGGALELLELRDTRPPATEMGPRTPTVAAVIERERGIECHGDTCRVDSEAVTRLLARSDELIGAVAIRPRFRDGRMNGAQVTHVTPGSLPARLGLRNGDVILAVNALPLDGIDRLVAVMEELRRPGGVTLHLERAPANPSPKSSRP